MIDFIMDNLFCSTDESPRGGPHADARAAACRRGGPRRPGEVISSQGFNKSGSGCSSHGDPPPPISLWERQESRHRESRNRTTSAEPLGGSFACTGAAFALQDDPLPGRGLYVSMQRGLGKRGRSTTALPPRGGPSSREPPRATSPTRGGSSLTCGGGSAITCGGSSVLTSAGTGQERQSWLPSRAAPAAFYEACHDDALDQLVEASVQQLPLGHARALMLRRFCPGEYEVDGRRVNIWIHAYEALAVPADGPEQGLVEPLDSFLRRAADAAYGRRSTGTNGGLAGAGGGGGSFYGVSFSPQDLWQEVVLPPQRPGECSPSPPPPVGTQGGATPGAGGGPSVRVAPAQYYLPGRSHQAKANSNRMQTPTYISVNG